MEEKRIPIEDLPDDEGSDAPDPMPEPEPDTTEDIYNLFCGNGRKGYV
jgi:hypothetical protein